MANKSFYVSTPIYYPSAKLHIGHTLTTTMADTIARYKKMKGYEVFFLTGSDEHGQKIERVAAEEGVKPIEYTDKIVATFKNLWSKMHIDYDDFIRTTEKRHYATVQALFQKIYDQGDIYKSVYEGFYCTSCETFFTKFQLDEGHCPDCGKEVDIVKEESYFFKMSKYADRLLEYIEEHPHFIQPESRRNEMISFIKMGLEDLSISRTTFDWGIPITIDEGHIIYVWFDALTNYITALDYLNDGPLYEKFWVNNEEIVHLVGKDIIRFHTIIWPIILMAAGIKLPTTVFGHGWLLSGGGKMSKSVGNVVDPLVLIEKYGADSLRYFLLREMPGGNDYYYSEDALAHRINVDLANDYGNLLSRTVSMIEKYFAGSLEVQESGFDEDIVALSQEVVASYQLHMDKLEFGSALQEVFKLVGRGNKFIEEVAPWNLVKAGETERLKVVMYELVEIIRLATIMLSPVLVETKAKVEAQLGIGEELFTFEQLNFGALKGEIKVAKGAPLFPRIEFKEVMEQEPEAEKKAPEKAETKSAESGVNLIAIDDFLKCQFKVGRILKSEKVEGADKLLKLQVKVGADEIRTIVAGIAQYYSLEELINKKVVVVYNLKPAKLRGIESQGMLLAAKGESSLKLLTVDGEIEEGAVVS
ncbi:MAG: methionine--tRNA ligase [Fusobacteria bacterium]|nr:methionine--tRNA ligase [Fusobacteriota bacterium]